MKKMGCLIVVVLFVAVAVASRSGKTGVSRNGSDKNDDGGPSNSDVYSTAKSYVKDFLKFPRDASFPIIEYDVHHNRGSREYRVSSTVLAKNAYGAALTQEWKATMQLNENRWKLLMCELGGEIVYVDKEIAKTVSDAMAKSTALPTKKPAGK